MDRRFFPLPRFVDFADFMDFVDFADFVDFPSIRFECPAKLPSSRWPSAKAASPRATMASSRMMAAIIFGGMIMAGGEKRQMVNVC